MKFGKIIVAGSLIFSSLFASDFIDYDTLSKNLKEEAKKDGNLATTDDVKKHYLQKIGQL